MPPSDFLIVEEMCARLYLGSALPCSFHYNCHTECKFNFDFFRAAHACTVLQKCAHVFIRFLQTSLLTWSSQVATATSVVGQAHHLINSIYMTAAERVLTFPFATRQISAMS